MGPEEAGHYDFVAVIEAPVDEERSLWVLPKLRRLVRTKPIKWVVNTRHDFDHIGGIRTYVAQGAAVVTHGPGDEVAR